MNSTALKRIMAFFADYLFIVIYGAILFGIIHVIRAVFGIDVQLSLTTGIMVDLLTLTLPVLAYFILSESGNRQGSLGKQIIKLKVYGLTTIQAPIKGIVIRNVLKFLPWEIAHFGIRFLKHQSDIGQTPQTWVWLLLIVPQLMVLVYFFSILLANGRQSLYDRAAQTQVA